MLALVRLLQLASPALPVGAYTYSQGLEWVVEAGEVRTENDVAAWLGDLLEFSVGSFEAPMVLAMIEAWQRGETSEIARLNDDFLASRETAELRAETVQMGYSLVRLLTELHGYTDLPQWRERLLAIDDAAFPTAWSAAAAAEIRRDPVVGV